MCTRARIIGPKREKKKKKSSRCVLVVASGIIVQTTVRFDKEFTEDLNDPRSSAFQELKSSVDEGVSPIWTGCLLLLLRAQCSNVLAVRDPLFSPVAQRLQWNHRVHKCYCDGIQVRLLHCRETSGGRDLRTLPTTASSSVWSHRRGSVAADFDVVVQELNPTEIARGNENLPAAMNSIAPVIGEVRSTFRSKLKQKYRQQN